MASPDIHPNIIILHKDNTKSPGNLHQLVAHLNRLGLEMAHGDIDLDTLSRHFSHNDVVKNSRFEIIENNNTVIMDTPRPDGTTTRCYLVQSYNDPNYIYLQVTSRITKFDGSENAKAEVDGIYPEQIKRIGLSFSSLNGDLMTFYGKGKGGIAVTDQGRVRLEQS